MIFFEKLAVFFAKRQISVILYQCYYGPRPQVYVISYRVRTHPLLQLHFSQRSPRRSQAARQEMSSLPPTGDDRSVLTVGSSPWMRTIDANAKPAFSSPFTPPRTFIPSPAPVAVVEPSFPLAGSMPKPVPTKEAKRRARKVREDRRLEISIEENEIFDEDAKSQALSFRLLLLGLFGLPLVHFVEVWYFKKELADSSENYYVRRNVFAAMFFGTLQVCVFIAWEVVYHTMREKLKLLSILNGNISLEHLT